MPPRKTGMYLDYVRLCFGGEGKASYSISTPSDESASAFC
jgi:hypothetical protein